MSKKSQSKNLMAMLRSVGLVLSVNDRKRVLKGERIALEFNITPAIAKKLIKHSAKNRRVRSYYVKDLARHMSRGRWYKTNEPITIDIYSKLIDGQHRLRAVILADVTLLMMVSFNAGKDAIRGIDGGCNRQMYERLNILDHSWVNQESISILSQMLFGAGKNAKRTQIYTEDYEDGLSQFHDGIKFATQMGKILYVNSPTLTPIAMAYYHPDKIGRRRLKEFLTCLKNGALSTGKDSAAWLLHNFLVENKAGRAYKAPRRDIYYMTEDAIRKFAKGTSTKSLQIIEQELFPLPTGSQERLIRRAAG